MILERKIMPSGEVKFLTPDGEGELLTHAEKAGCKFGCVVHRPTIGPMSTFPYNWRSDKGIMERVCPHGIGHPDNDEAVFRESIGMEHELVHDRDGCCGEMMDWSYKIVD